jgi:hypothetical protein
MSNVIEPDEVSAYAAKIGERAATVAVYDGQLLSTAPAGLQANGDLDQALRLDPDWFGGPLAPWSGDIEATINMVYDSRNAESLRIHEELTGIQTDLNDFVQRWEEDEDATAFEFNNASDAE